MRSACLALALLAGCVGPVRVGLLPRMAVGGQSTRDPDPTRPLVPTQPGPGMETGRGPDPGPSAGPRVTLGGSVSVASTLVYLLGGAAPLLGVYGTFDENQLADPRLAETPLEADQKSKSGSGTSTHAE